MKRGAIPVAVAVAIATLTMAAGAAHAQSVYPSKPVRVVIPYAPGGGVDIVGRFVGAKLAEEFKQQFIADNRTCADGTVGNDIVAKAPADGYTLLTMNRALTYLPSLYPKAQGGEDSRRVVVLQAPGAPATQTKRAIA